MKQFNIWMLLVITGVASCTPTKNDPAKESLVSVSGSGDLSQLVGMDYLIDDQHSYLGFKIKYFGYSPVRGRFNSFDGTLFYDPDMPGALSVNVFVDLSTINTGNDTRDEDLKREGAWFDVQNYPYASFQSMAVRWAEDGSFALDGELTIKGVTKNIRIDFKRPTAISRDWARNEQVDFEGTTVINRQDFEVFGGDFWSTIMEDGLTQLSDEVEIELNLHCRRADYLARYDSAAPSDLDKVVLDLIETAGIELGLAMIDSLADASAISSGKLSTIGYTLQARNKLEEAQQVFEWKRDLFGTSTIVLNQLGINQLKLMDITQATDYFNQALQMDSLDSRSTEYLRLIEKIKARP